MAIPANVAPGCFVSVVVETGKVVSNTVTIPVSPNGGACSDPATGLSGTQIQTLATKAGGKTNSILMAISQNTSGAGTNAGAIVLSGGISSADFGKGYEYASQGSCIIVPPEQGSLFNQVSPLDAGAIQLTGPNGQSAVAEQGPGFYQTQVSKGGPAPAGTYTFSGGGGADVGSFTASVNLQSPLTLTNQKALAVLDRTKDATVTWSGGFANGDVQVEGAIGDQYGTVRFYCHAASNAGQLTIPSSILLGMPVGSGDLVVTNTTAAQPVTATGIDVGFAVGTALTKYDLTLK